MNIEFIAIDKFAHEVANRPVPSSSLIPGWWKDMPMFSDENGNKQNSIVIENGKNNLTPKKCVPMLDAITSGYIVPLWADVQIRSLSDSEYIPAFFWRVDRAVFEINSSRSRYLTSPIGFMSNTIKFVNQWMIKTPSGYSSFITHPAGYSDLPVKTVPAIVDTDTFNSILPIPMWLQEGFEGNIESGTPMFQVLPFKREEWNSKFSFLEDGQLDIIQNKTVKNKLSGYYINNNWKKKKYR